MEVLFEEGMKVKEKQVLARLDDSNLKTSLDVAQAQLESTRLSLDETRAQLKQADQEFQRTTDLAANSKLLAIRSRQSGVRRHDAAGAPGAAGIGHHHRRTPGGAMWQQQIEDMVIRAPFDGVVTTKDAQPGEMISPVSAGGGFTRTGIGTIVDMNRWKLNLTSTRATSTASNRVSRRGDLDAYPDWKIPCKVIAIIPTADRQKSTVKVRVGFDKLDPRILPDMSRQGRLSRRRPAQPAPSTQARPVPKSALQSRTAATCFVVQRPRGTPRRHGQRHGGRRRGVERGLSAGEKVIVEWIPAGLKDGAAVKEKKS
jgi:HlyD family secretion protein